MSKTSKKNISRKYRLKRKTLKRRYSTKKKYRASSQRGGRVLWGLPGLSTPLSTKTPTSAPQYIANSVGNFLGSVKETAQKTAENVQYESELTFSETLGKSDNEQIFIGTGTYNDRKIKYNPKENTLKYFELDSGVLKGTINLNINPILSYKLIGKRYRGYNDKREGLLITFNGRQDLYLWSNDIGLLIKLCNKLGLEQPYTQQYGQQAHSQAAYSAPPGYASAPPQAAYSATQPVASAPQFNGQFPGQQFPGQQFTGQQFTGQPVQFQKPFTGQERP